MKLFKSILFTLLSLSIFTNISLAKDVCPGTTAKLVWSSANCVATGFSPNATNPACRFDNDAQPNTSGSKVVTAGNTPGGFCKVSLTCTGNQGTTASSQAELVVKNEALCCNVKEGSALAEGRNLWREAGGKYTEQGCYKYTPPVITATTTPVSTNPTNTAPTVKWDCESPATSYDIVRTPAWASAPAWASGV